MKAQRRESIAPCILAIVKEIDADLSRNWKIDDLVRISGYRKRHLQSLFKQATGMTIGRYIKKRRLSRAAIQLKFTNRPLYDIAEESRYSTITAFYKAFKKTFQTTPQQFRSSQVTDFSPLQGSLADHMGSFISLGIHKKQFCLSGHSYLWPENLLPPANPQTSRKKSKILSSLLKTGNAVYAVKTLYKKNSLKDVVVLKVFVGVENLEGKYRMETRSYNCFEFNGEWDEYHNSVRLLYMHGNFIKEENPEVECFSYSDQSCISNQLYNIKLYIPTA